MKKDARLSIREIVVVEGLHDKQAVMRVADADVWVLGGDRIATRLVAELRRAAKHRGVIILTDPDGPGERIRRRLENALPNCKHAFVPKSQAIANGAVGVEHAADDTLRAALEGARPTVPTDDPRCSLFTLGDLINAGLVSTPTAAQRRAAIGEILGIGYGNAKAFLHKMNALGVKRQEWEHAISIVDGELKGKEGSP